MIPPRAPRSPVPPDDCNLTRAIGLIGDKWTLMILRAAMYGVRRFDDFHAELAAPRTVLSQRLKQLTAAGLLEKCTYKVPGKRARPEYVLTQMGAELRPILIGITQWGDTWLNPDGTIPISFAAKNGSAVKASFVDEAGQEVRPGDMRVVLRKMGTV